MAKVSRRRGTRTKAERSKKPRRKAAPKAPAKAAGASTRAKVAGARRRVSRGSGVATSGRSRGPARRSARTRAAEVAALARRVVHATTRGQRPNVSRLYDEHCISIESDGSDPAIGHAEREARFDAVAERIDSGSWAVRNLWLAADTFAIEWDAELRLASGRIVQFVEVAVHQVRDGRIVAERFYYDPALLR